MEVKRNPEPDVYNDFFPMYIISRCIGLFPVSYHTQASVPKKVTFVQSRVTQAYSLAIIITAFTLLMMSFRYTGDLFADLVIDGKNRSKILFINKVGFITGALISVGSAVFCFTSSSRIIRMLQALSSVDEMFKMPGMPEGLRPRHRLLRSIAIFQIVSIFLETAYCDYKDYKVFGTMNIHDWTLAPVYFLRMLSFFMEQQFFHFAIVFRERFVLINSALKSSSGSRVASRKEPIRRHGHHNRKGMVFDKKLMERLCQVHAILSEEIETVTLVYQLPLIADLILLFFDFTAGSYFLLSNAIEEISSVKGLAWSWVIHSTLRLAALSWIGWDVSIKAKEPETIVMKMMERKIGKEVEKELQILVAHVSQTEVRFNLLGLFHLDMTLLQAMAQAATSYLLLILQFQTTQQD